MSAIQFHFQREFTRCFSGATFTMKVALQGDNVAPFRGHESA